MVSHKDLENIPGRLTLIAALSLILMNVFYRYIVNRVNHLQGKRQNKKKGRSNNLKEIRMCIR